MCSTTEAEPTDKSNVTPTKATSHLVLYDTENSRVERHDPGVGGLNFCSLVQWQPAQRFDNEEALNISGSVGSESRPCRVIASAGTKES